MQAIQKANLRKDFGLLNEFMLAVAGVVIVAILVFSINTDARSDYTAGTVEYNATLDADEAVAKVPARLPLLGTAVVFGVVLYVIYRVIPGMGGRGSTQ